MAQMASAAIILPRVSEACPANISPTTSTTLMLALGDALAVATMSMRGITRQQLERLHPGGNIGLRLLPVNDVMHAGDRLPLVGEDSPMREVLVTITDGDLRRNVDRLLISRAVDVMTRHPKVISDGTYAEDAMAILTANKITALFVMDHDDPEKPIGVVHIHDFNRLGMN
jgi:arabinose-5-phosphate isomerase